jgi:hypothetical protein
VLRKDQSDMKHAYAFTATAVPLRAGQLDSMAPLRRDFLFFQRLPQGNQTKGKTWKN